MPPAKAGSHPFGAAVPRTAPWANGTASPDGLRPLLARSPMRRNGRAIPIALLVLCREAECRRLKPAHILLRPRTQDCALG